MNVRTLALALLGALALAGCAPTSVSNLTPRTLPMTADRTYPFELTWDTGLRGVKPEDVKAWVVIDGILYPMTRVPVAVNRWEARVPIAPGRTYVPYRFRIDFLQPKLGTPRYNSEWSQEYRLVVPQQ